MSACLVLALTTLFVYTFHSQAHLMQHNHASIQWLWVGLLIVICLILTFQDLYAAIGILTALVNIWGRESSTIVLTYISLLYINVDAFANLKNVEIQHKIALGSAFVVTGVHSAAQVVGLEYELSQLTHVVVLLFCFLIVYEDKLSLICFSNFATFSSRSKI